MTKSTARQQIWRFIYLFVWLVPALSFATSSGVPLELNVLGCNNNLICEAGAGEDILTCPLDCTPEPPPSEPPRTYPPGGKRDPISIGPVLIYPGDTTALIRWTSLPATASQLSWGLTTEYLSGTNSSLTYTLEHTVRLNNLIPGTTYFFSIYSQDQSDRSVTSGAYAFTTSGGRFVPPEVTDARLVPSLSNLIITWKNPKFEDFNYVRIVRGTNQYPSGPFDGLVVYEGEGERLLDADVLRDKHYYYAIFVRDHAGTYSNGVGVNGKLFSLMPDISDLPEQSVVPDISDFSEQGDNYQPPYVDSNFLFSFSQREELLPVSVDQTFVFASDWPLKMIVTPLNPASPVRPFYVRLTSPTGRVTDFFLRKGAEAQPVYSTVIPSFPLVGEYEFSVMAETRGELSEIAHGFLTVHRDKILGGARGLDGWNFPWWLLIILFFLIVSFLELVRRRREQANVQKNNSPSAR